MRTIKFTGVAGSTVSETTTNTAQDIDAGVAGIAFKNSDDLLISSLYITVSTNPIRYSFTATPVQGGLGHILLAGTDLEIFGAANIRAFRFISSGVDAHALLAVTPFYGDE